MSYAIKSRILKDGTMVKTVSIGDRKVDVRINVVYKGQLTSDYSDFIIVVQQFEDVINDEYATDEDKFDVVSRLSESLRDVIGDSQYRKIKKLFKDSGEVLTEEILVKIIAAENIDTGVIPKG